MIVALAIALAHAGLSSPIQSDSVARQVSESGIKHGLLALGAETFLMTGDGKTVWTYPRSTRDGWVLPNGNLLLVITKSADYPGGGIVEITREGRKIFEYRGAQSEVDTVQPLTGGRILVTESGPKPRLMEMDRSGKILVEFPLQSQTVDFHMQTRMARKLKNGHYLVPHLIDMAVKEYDSTGRVVWDVRTPNWPFQALREKNGNTLITCTRGNMVIEVDREGKTVWTLTNDDLPGAPLKDACAAHILRNGHIMVESYGAGGPDEVKLIEVTRDKKIVWALYTGRAHGIHEFQLLKPDGKTTSEIGIR